MCIDIDFNIVIRLKWLVKDRALNFFPISGYLLFSMPVELITFDTKSMSGFFY